MMHHQLLALLLPPGAYDPNGEVISAELWGEGRALDRAQHQAGIAIQAITPLTGGGADLLPDWERVCGLTPAVDAPYQQRLGAVLAKLRETGGLSIPYFVDLASRLGYDITIDEFQAFYCDWSILDVDALYNADAMWCYQVNVHGDLAGATYFRAGQSSANEYLLSFVDPVIEAVFNDLKPAHTFCTFNYEAQP